MKSSQTKNVTSEARVPATLVLVAPRVGSGGVGDYAEDFAAETSKYFEGFAQVRTGGPGQITLSQLMRDWRLLRQTLKSSSKRGPVVLHFELSAGSISPFWLMVGNRGVLTTATVHDPPYTVWWPFRTRFLSKTRIANHGLHYPIRRLSALIERFTLGGVVLFALSDMGSEALKVNFPSCEVRSARHFVPVRPSVPVPSERPLAVGLFGHAYKGKGFDRLLELRAALPSDISINVAGRGTEKLPKVEGVNILGGVDGAKEDEFFRSIRAVLLPYANTSRYGNILSVSGVAARAFAYGTPVVAGNSGTLPEAADHGGVALSPNSIDSIADVASQLVCDESSLGLLAEEASRLRAERKLENAVKPFLDRWGKSASPTST